MTLMKWFIATLIGLVLAFTTFLVFQLLEYPNIHKGVRILLYILLILQVPLLVFFPHALLFCGGFFMLKLLYQKYAQKQ